MEIKRVRIDDIFGWILAGRVLDSDVGCEVEKLYNQRQRGKGWNDMFEVELRILSQRQKALLETRTNG